MPREREARLGVSQRPATSADRTSSFACLLEQHRSSRHLTPGYSISTSDVDNRLRDSIGKIADAIARSWHAEEELRSAAGYLAHIYKSERPTGFAIATHNRSPQEVATYAIRQCRLIPAEPQYADVLLAILKGTFAQEAQGETKP